LKVDLQSLRRHSYDILNHSPRRRRIEKDLPKCLAHRQVIGDGPVYPTILLLHPIPPVQMLVVNIKAGLI